MGITQLSPKSENYENESQLQIRSLEKKQTPVTTAKKKKKKKKKTKTFFGSFRVILTPNKVTQRFK